jgi:hypothetical protein
MHTRNTTALFHSIQMGLPNLWCSAFCPDDIVQVACILQEPIAQAWTCRMGYDTEFCVLSNIHCYVPVSVFPPPICPHMTFIFLCSMGLFQALPPRCAVLPNSSQAPTEIYRLPFVKIFLWIWGVVWCAVAFC